MSIKDLTNRLSKILNEDVERVESSIEDEINAAQPVEKQFEKDSWEHIVRTGDYDYAYDVTVKYEQKAEVVNGNDPDREVVTTETWYADEKPAVKCTTHGDVDGPYHPDTVEVLDPQALYDILMGLGLKADLFN